MAANSLKKNVVYATIGNLGYAAFQYLILLIYIKLFTTQEVGIFVYALAFTAPLTMALDMQLRTLYLTDSGTHKLNEYISFRTLTNLIAVVALGISAYFMKVDYFLPILLISCIKAFESQLDLIYGVYQKNHRLDFVAYSKIIRGLIAAGAVLLVSYLTKNINYSLFAYLSSWVILYFLYERKLVVKRGLIPSSDLRPVVLSFDKIKMLMLLGLPLFAVILLDRYYANYPRLYIETKFGLGAVGIFGSLLYFKVLAGQLIAAIGQSTVPVMSKHLLSGDLKSFDKLTLRLLVSGFSIGLVSVIISVFFGEYLLTLLYNKEYAQHAEVLSYIFIGSALNYSYIFIGTALTCLRKQWIKLPITIFGFALLFLLLYFLRISGLKDVALIIIGVEMMIFIIYFLIYKFYLKKHHV